MTRNKKDKAIQTLLKIQKGPCEIFTNWTECIWRSLKSLEGKIHMFVLLFLNDHRMILIQRSSNKSFLHLSGIEFFKKVNICIACVAIQSTDKY